MKLFLIDGHALIFKMYYAFLGRPMVNSRGEDTSIIFGFTRYLLDLIGREHPTHIAVSFDPPGGTFRNRLYPAYKANRGETPQLVIDSLEPLTNIVKALDIPVLMVHDFEADDVIGTMAKRFHSSEMDVYMVTPDKDYGQLVGPGIYQLKPGKGGSDSEILGVKQICDKYGLSSTSQVIDMLALCGDASDNVPGVQGIGPVGASKLLDKYGTLENIYAHLDELTARQKTMFESAKDHIALSKELVTIRTDVPIDVELSQMKISSSIGSKIMSYIEYYQMPSLSRLIDSLWKVDLSGVIAGKNDESKKTDALSFRKVDFSEIQSAAVGAKALSIYTTDFQHASICVGDAVYTGPIVQAKALLEDASIEKRGYSIKSQMSRLRDAGIVLNGRLMDVELLHYVLNPERNHHLDAVVKEFLGVDLDAHEGQAVSLSLFDEPRQDSFSEEESRQGDRESALAIWKCAPMVYEALDSMRSVYDGIEEPLIRVLYIMESYGVRIDVSVLKDFTRSLKDRMSECEKRIREIADNPNLNVASPKQLGELLFEKLQIDPKMKRTGKGSWPTDEEKLSALSDKNPVVEDILEYRGTRKLLSTYIEPLPGYISPKDGRVHTTFNQALTATGRLSSSSPNLQNIPIRTEDGQQIRKAFVAPQGSVVMSADYSQIELRVMAHCCGDEHMIKAFKDGEDIHKTMAAKIFGKSLEDVTPEERRKAKTANFGIMYGISAFGLAQRLKISRTEASKLITDYYASFPSIRQFLDKVLDDARKNGYVQTLFGRRRYVPDVNSRNANVRSIAERNAINAPIQGTAADIIKLAMIGVQDELEKRNLHSHLVLQIHDELVLEVPCDEIDIVKKMLIERMEGVMQLSVPLTVECNYGKDWLEAHR
mgnify:FL=1